MFKVVVESLRKDNSEDLCKGLRLISALSHADAKALVAYLESALPCTLAAGVSRDRSSQIVAMINRLGGSARVDPTDIDRPMLVWPAVNVAHESTFWGIRDVAPSKSTEPAPL